MTGKLVAIVGPTASGKSGLGIRLARKFQGEIISADSRQVYRGMDLGTGKVTKAQQRLIPHHLLDVTAPNRQYTVARFKREAARAIKDISSRGRLPIIVGGTAFYVYSLIDDWHLPDSKPDLKLRQKLGKLTAPKLFAMLQKLDPVRAKSIDRHNPARLIRAIEIVKTTGQPVPAFQKQDNEDILLLGLKVAGKTLHANIDQRLAERLKAGLVKEVMRLRKSGVSHRRLQSFGLEYKFVSLHLQDKLTYDDMVLQLRSAIKKYAKRQMTWFRKDTRIKWVSTPGQAERLVQKFLK